MVAVILGAIGAVLKVAILLGWVGGDGEKLMLEVVTSRLRGCCGGPMTASAGQARNRTTQPVILSIKPAENLFVGQMILGSIPDLE